jgi:hypothetical protein
MARRLLDGMLQVRVVPTSTFGMPLSAFHPHLPPPPSF